MRSVECQEVQQVDISSSRKDLNDCRDQEGKFEIQEHGAEAPSGSGVIEGRSGNGIGMCSGRGATVTVVDGVGVLGGTTRAGPHGVFGGSKGANGLRVDDRAGRYELSSRDGCGYAGPLIWGG